MTIDFKIKLNSKLYLKDPDSSDIGKAIITHAIKLISEIGYENFTFKKLANQMPSTEATIYRYFENKHMLLFYLIDWYWAFLRYQILYNINNLGSAEDKIRKCIDLLVWEDNTDLVSSDIDFKALYYIAISESSKTYLSKEVDEHNKEKLYMPYKELCELLATLFKAYNPNYKYANSLASTVVEASHFQYYFMQHLPRLCDFAVKKDPKEIELFLENLIFSALRID